MPKPTISLQEAIDEGICKEGILHFLKLINYPFSKQYNIKETLTAAQKKGIDTSEAQNWLENHGYEAKPEHTYIPGDWVSIINRSKDIVIQRALYLGKCSNPQNHRVMVYDKDMNVRGDQIYELERIRPWRGS